MKIAHIVPNSVKFPLEIHNGRYDWVLQLAQQQVKNGHDVTIYCNPSSSIPAIHTIGLDSPTEDKNANNSALFKLALDNKHDIYHSHFDNLQYKEASSTTVPIVFTQHWWPHNETVEIAQLNPGNVWAVPPTRYMYDFDVRSHILTRGFIYHGIDLEMFKPSRTEKNGRLLFVGRLAPEKNLDIAIKVAQESGIGLDIIGKIVEKHARYWESLEPLIDGKHIRYLGPKTHADLVDYYSAALAVLFPSDVNEPFGLVAIESQACGTPIIMKSGGSRPELLKDNETGFLCTTQADFVSAAHAATQINPHDCRSFAEQFSLQTMAQKYGELYEHLLAA